MNYFQIIKIQDLLLSKKTRSQFIRIMKLTCFILFTFMLQMNATTYSQNTKFDMFLENVSVKDNLIVVTPEREGSQTIVVTGTVSDANGPLPGVSVRIKGTTSGTATDMNGRFSLNVPDGDAVLQFSFIGYLSTELTVGSQTVFNVTLREDTQQIDEVVVIGYGTVRKRDLTGAVSTIKSADVNFPAAASVGHALQGKAAGMSVIQNSAQPGGGLDILIRGAGSVNAGNEPLYVVDGFPIITPEYPGGGRADGTGGTVRRDPGTQGVLNFINPNDIASIEIMKDASATAIYGSRAANGVVLITTQRGREGKPVVSFNASYGIQKYIEVYDVLNMKEWMEERNVSRYDQWLFNNNVFPYGPRTVEEAKADPSGGLQYIEAHTAEEIRNAGTGTDWLSLVTRNGKVENYNLNVTGGTSSTKYMASLGYYDNEGIIKSSRTQRYSGKLNLDLDLGKYVKSSVSLLATRMDNDNVPLGSSRYEQMGIIRAAVNYRPDIAARNPDGTYPMNMEKPDEPNPYSLLEITDNTIRDRVMANVGLTVEPIKNLLLKYYTGIDFSYQKRGSYMPVSTYHGAMAGGMANIWNVNHEQYVNEITVNYSFDLNKIHRFSILAGYSFEKTKASSSELSNNSFIIDGFLWNNMNAGSGTKNVGSGHGENKRASYFGRINYTMLDRYLFTATLRADGASVFAKNHKWGSFPSVAVGWNMAEENFMASTKNLINMMKWRLSWGQTGNSNIGSNAFAAYYAETMWYSQAGDRLTGVRQTRLENPYLKWETTTEWNLGLDVSFSVLNGISATFEVYNRVISDLLASKSLDFYQEINSVMSNIGKTQSRGFEFTLNTRNVTRENFSWTTDYTFTIYRDRWKERADNWVGESYQKVNDPIRARYTNLATGILQIGDPIPEHLPALKPGQIIVADLDGYVMDETGNPVVDEKTGRRITTGKPDGIFDSADRYLMGSSDPGYFMGLANKLMYRGFDFNFYFYGMFDRTMEDPTFMSYGLVAGGIGTQAVNALRVIRTRWLPHAPSTTQRSGAYEYTAYGDGDWHYQKAWFIRMQNISLGYTLPNRALSKVFSSCRIHFDVNNVFVITPYTGIDPETDSYTAAYPNARTFTFGIDLKF